MPFSLFLHEVTRATLRLCDTDGSIDESVDALLLQLQSAVAAGVGPSSLETFHKLLPNDDDSIIFLGVLNLFRECAHPFPLIVSVTLCTCTNAIPAAPGRRCSTRARLPWTARACWLP